MKTYPLPHIDLEEAMEKQFKLIDEITKVFRGHEILTRGDLGVIPDYNKPITTYRAEQIIAAFFGAQSSILVRGAGTGAIRYALFAALRPGGTLLVHRAPIYNTTKTSIEMMGLKVLEADFNRLDEIKRVLYDNSEVEAVLIQYTRQSMEDRYEINEVIKTIKSLKDIPVITDDNYAVMKVSKIGCEHGADLSCFSTFKLLGPEGIGCVVGKKEYIDKLVKHLYSGGSQTQGFEALEVLRGLTYAPVSLAIQAKVNKEIVDYLNKGSIFEVEGAHIANAQSNVILVEFKENIAKEVLFHAEQLGAAPNPIGAESKYELVPMFYRISGTFAADDPTINQRMIRINPMRSGVSTVLRILKDSIERVKSCS